MPNEPTCATACAHLGRTSAQPTTRSPSTAMHCAAPFATLWRTKASIRSSGGASTWAR